MKANQYINNGLIMFSTTPLTVKFSDLFEVSVGCVAKSKKDISIAPDQEIMELVHSKTQVDGSLLRAGVTYTEWVRPPNGKFTNIFVNCKTRQEKPFFARLELCEFDGSVLGLFPKEACKELFASCKTLFASRQDVLNYLNNQDWQTLGFKSPEGRYQFSQRSLQNCLLTSV